MRNVIRHAFTLILFTMVSHPVLAQSPDTPEWSAQRTHRILLRVEPGPDVRLGDERPAEVAIDFEKQLAAIAPGRIPDLNTLQIHRYDPQTGRVVASVKSAFGASEFDVPWRWYDAAIPYDFPEFSGNINATDGKLNYENMSRFGYFYDCIGDWRKGRLVSMHRSTDANPGCYAAYFDLLSEDARPELPEPRAFMGDGLHRCEPAGESTTGLIHTRVDVCDWNGDGLLDLVAGCARGGMIWYENRGTKESPSFPSARLMFSADASPLDVGWSSAPKAADWDSDGDLDLVVGAEWNRLLLYRNTGEPGSPLLMYEGFVRTDDGQPLSVPFEPSPETQPHFAYTRDYYPVPETADWDGDGDLDLLAGGYVTGRIFLFQNTAEPKQEPRLRFAGPLDADGQPLDVGWAAAPSVADLDGDGDLDLVSGCMPMTAGGGDSASSEHFVHLFRNVGTRREPRLHEERLPRTGAFPTAALGTPRVCDWNADGLSDLVASAGTMIYLYRNTGTVIEPCFEAHSKALPSRWGSAKLAATQFIDWNGDGLLDGISAPFVALSAGAGNPGVFASPFSILAEGQTISHRSGIGDDWQFQRVFDLDADGRPDIMDADHAGHFWWHANRGSKDKADFDTAGVMLTLSDGSPVSVGEGREGFNALQGARATYTIGDFNGDGLPDLVTADTFGNVRYFQQAPKSTPEAAPRFDASIDIGKLSTYGVPCAADWNGDGHLDVLAGSSASDMTLLVGREPGSSPPFDAAKPIALPPAPYGAGQPVVVVDYNADGDSDILLYTAYGYLCFNEHSFIEAGYASVNLVSVQTRPDGAK